MVTGNDTDNEWLIKHANPKDQWLSEQEVSIWDLPGGIIGLRNSHLSFLVTLFAFDIFVCHLYSP
jgi:hypothetical protein